MFKTWIDVLLLAIVQGVTEFLPISSSGHLALGRHLLGLESAGMQLEIGLHVGTLASIFIFYRAIIWRIIRQMEWQYVLKIGVSAIPAVVVYFCFHDFIDGVFDNTQMIGALLMFTGAVLIGTRYLPLGKKDVSFFRAFLMGLGQALALLPGVSRSGMTIACARGGAVLPEKSAEFSFLMSAPLILGGLLLDILRYAKASSGVASTGASSMLSYELIFVGALLAGTVGYFSLVFLVKTLKGKGFWLFGPYCVCVGLLTLILL